MEIEKEGVSQPAESETAVVENGNQPSPATEENQGNDPQTPTGQAVENSENEVPKDHKAFAELRVKNKQLEERLRQFEGNDQMTEEEAIALEELRHPGGMMPQQGFTPDMSAEEALGRMTQAERVAYEANQTVQALTTKLENQQLYSKFPELNPDGEDYKKPETRAFEELLAGQYLIQKMSGKPVDLVKLAAKVKSQLTGASQEVAERVSQERIQNLTKKENATLEAKGNSVVIPRSQNEEERRMRIRQGDQSALAESLLEDELKDLDI